MKNNRSGFSLVQVMVAAGMMAALSLAFMKMMENQRKSQRSLETGLEVASFISNVKTFLSFKTTCFKTLEENDLNGQKIDKILDYKGLGKYIIGNKYGDNKFLLTDMYISDVAYQNEDETLATGKFHIGVKKVGKSFGASLINKNFEFVLSFDHDQNLTNCGTYAMANNIVSMGGIVNVEGLNEAVKEVSGVKSKTEEVGDTIISEVTNLTNKSVPENKKMVAEDVQKIIDANPELRALQESAKSVLEQNLKIEQMLKDQE